jgi:hypothetical protein
LLNEFDKKKLILSGIEFGLWFIKEDAWKGLLKYRNYESNVSISYAISKSYWFIERLIKNDKIKWIDKTELYYNISCYDWDWWEYELIWPNFTDTEQIIMILSIQDNPIEYLCSILKE